MKRLILAFFASVVLLSVTGLAQAETETTLILEKGSAQKFCAVEKETTPVYYVEYEKGGTIVLGKMHCIKCVCPERGECYPVEAKCQDEKNKK